MSLQGDLRSLTLQHSRLESTISIRQEQLQALVLKIEAAGGGASDASGAESDKELYSVMSLAALEALVESLQTQQAFIRSRLGKEPKGESASVFLLAGW